MKPNWLTRIVFALTTVTLLVLGFFFLTVVLVVGAAAALVFGARLWWTMRKLKRAQGSQGSFDEAPMPQGKTVVEGEYQVIELESRTDKLPAPNTPTQPPINNTPPAP